MTDTANNIVLNLRIEGMHCAACVRRVTQTLSKLPNTEVDSVEIGSATIHGTPNADEVMDALKKAGFTASML